MFLSNHSRGVAFGGLIAVLACLPGCSSDKTSNQSSPLSADIVREGTVTTPALNEILGTPPDDWPWAGGQFLTPMDQDTLMADPPEAFTWQADNADPPNPADLASPTKQQGQTFLLVFSTPDDPKLLRVFTSLFAYTPSETAWQKLVTASQPVTLSITSGTFENDQLTGEGIPHSGQTLSFTIQ
jgi:hypothetical protein